MTETTTGNTPSLTVQCPTCQADVVWGETFPHRPFCSKRCQLVDFGEWANENHRIVGDDNDIFSSDKGDES